MCPVWFRHGIVTSSAQKDERSINPSRHVSSNSGALKINNCKLDRCKIAPQIFNRRISSSSSSLNQCFPVCRFFYTHPISFLTKKLEYRKVFFPSIPMNQIGSNRVRSGLQTISMWRKNSTFNVYFMTRNWFVAHHRSSFSRCLFTGSVSVIFMTRHKMGQVLS